MESGANPKSYLSQYSFEKRKRKEFYEKQSQLFQSVLAHVDEQVTNQMDKVTLEEQSKVLIIYTGGTIGMVHTEKGYTIKKGFLSQSIKANKYLCDAGYTYFNAQDDFMITPVSIYRKRIWFKLIEFDQIRDSSTFNTEEWVAIASLIEKEYDNYNAFVILHGTDTMAFTASALSFMLENLKKTIVVTGSQVPLSEMRNDAFENLLGALTIAGHFTIPEVTVFFKDKLFRGNRSKKVDTFGLDAFNSPDLPPLGSFGFYLKLDWSLIRKPTYKKFTVHKEMSKKVGLLKIFPMIPGDLMDCVFKSDIDACIIEAYGAGNLPINRPEIAEALSKACERGKIIVIISQCTKGTVNALYSIGKQVKDLGIVTGLDMTLECAVAKLSYLLGKGLSHKEIVAEIQNDLRGELTEIVPPNFHVSQDTFIKAISDALNISTEYEPLKNAVFPTIMCYAADFGYMSVLKEVKKFGGNLESGDYEGRTPLHIAARKGHVNLIHYLIGEGVSLDSVDKYGKSALYEAIVCQRFDAAKVLIQAGAKVLADQSDFSDYMFKIVAKGDIETLRFFYYAGIKDLQIFTNIDKRTIAHIAVAENQMEIIEFLRDEVGFNFNIQDRWGQTPIDEAKRMGTPEVISVLSMPSLIGKKFSEIKDH